MNFAAKDVSFSYSRQRNILNGISFSMQQGDMLCLLGPNGTGKTTLLRCLLGIRRPTHGTILVDGRDIFSMKPQERAGYIAYVPQFTSLAFSYEVQDVVLMGRTSKLASGAAPTKKDREAVEEALSRLHIERLAKNRFPELSGGEKQMVLVARALAQASSILIMDEPAASLDYGNQIRILKVARSLTEEGYAILMTSHQPDHAFWACNRVALMKDGRIYKEGSPEAVITSENLTSLYETPVCVADARLNEFGSTAKASIPLF
ncbi:ABC transporter ATP-binding protein [Christensenellaceae bacterium OttesenSCG-928-M15]|nr:ABC transporter ATP-binding protein [Christensenellaceae bacterium OttesenSCG-928-M15]